MRPLFLRSVGLTSKIYVFCVVEWALFIGLFLWLRYLSIRFVHDEALDIVVPVLLPLIVPLMMAMSLSHMRTALLKLHETGSIDFGKISKYVWSLLRFIGIMAPLVLLCLAGVLAVMFAQGLFTRDEAMFILATVQNREPLVAIALFNSGTRLVYLGIMVLIMMLASSFIMIPMAASATSAGEGANYYDPFYGFGRRALPLLTVTILVLILSAALLYAGYELFNYLYASFMQAHNDTLPPLQAAIMKYGPVVYAFLALVWTSTIWFCSAVLAFIDYRHVVAEKQYELQLNNARQADAQRTADMRSLRQSLG